MVPRVLVNALGSRSGGAQAYVLALLEELKLGGTRDLNWEWLVTPELARARPALDAPDVVVRALGIPRPALRVAWEQTVLPVRGSLTGPKVLVSLSNFGPLATRSPHILLSQNALHFSDHRVMGRNRARLAIEGALGRASVRRSTVTITATASMSRLVEARTGRTPITIPFGPGLVRRRISGGNDRFTFLHRTAWGSHKRLADLLMAVRELAKTNPGSFTVQSACDPYSQFARKWKESEPERVLMEDPQIRRHIRFESFGRRGQTELDGDAVVVPSVTESFCFPLAEAIAFGLPVVAADAPFAREMCGDSAFFAASGDPRQLAAAMRRLLMGESPPPPSEEHRARFSWPNHVDRLAELCHGLAANGRRSDRISV